MHEAPPERITAKLLLPQGSGKILALEVAGSREALTHLVAKTGGTIVRLGPEPPREASLTAKQEKALVAAALAGYYDVPRKARLSDVAARLGRSPAAVSELLRRGEAHILREHVRARAAREIGFDREWTTEDVRPKVLA